MKCLAVFIVLLGLSLALPIGALKEGNDLLDSYSEEQTMKLRDFADYIISYKQQLNRPNQLARTEAILDLCGKHPVMSLLGSLCDTPTPTSQPIEDPESSQAQTSTSRVKAQDLSEILPFLSNLFRESPALRRLATGLVSGFASYVNQTKTDTTLADILNSVRKGGNNFDSLLEKSIPTVLQRIKEFMTGSSGSEQDVPSESISTNTPSLATNPPPTTRPRPLSNILSNIISKLPPSIAGKVDDLVRRIVNKKPALAQAITAPHHPLAQGIAAPSIPVTGTLSSYRGFSRCFTKRLTGDDLIRCLAFSRSNANYQASRPVDDGQIVAKSQDSTEEAEEEMLQELERILNDVQN